MNKSTLRKQKAALRKRQARTMFVTSLPETTLAPAKAPVIEPAQQQASEVSPGVAAFLAELHQFAIQYQKLCLRASHRLMVAGLKEASQNHK
jgi:hypothetical protein